MKNSAVCPSRASSRVGFDGQLRASSPQASHPQPGTTALLRLRTPPLWTSGCTKQPVVAVGVGDPSMNAAPHGDATTKPLAQRVLEGTGEPRAGARLAGVCRVQPRQETGRASESRRSGPRTQPSHSGPRLQGPSTRLAGKSTRPPSRRRHARQREVEATQCPARVSGDAHVAPGAEGHAAVQRKDVLTQATPRTDFEDITL